MIRTNTKWLYVNPIIGRVLNGYAITEATKYRRFEDGTRTYPNGDKEYWQTDGTIETRTKAQLEEGEELDTTMTASAAPVTMRNGNKNYSITDIDTSEVGENITFSMSGIADNSNITVSSAQALFIMSLITQCGLGKSSNGLYDQTNKAVAASRVANLLKPYDSYMSTHLADYSYIGSTNLPAKSNKPTGYSTSDTKTATDYASDDYYTAEQNDKYSGYGTDKIPYIIKEYTNTLLTVNSETVYPAFDCAGDTDHYFNLILSGSDTTFYLPDSYRGLGSLML